MWRHIVLCWNKKVNNHVIVMLLGRNGHNRRKRLIVFSIQYSCVYSRKTGVCIYIYDPVGTNSVDRPFNVPTAYSGWKTKTSTIIQAKRNKWKIIVKNGTFLHPTIFFNLYIMPTHVSVDKRKMYTKDKQNIIYKGGIDTPPPKRSPVLETYPRDRATPVQMVPRLV